MPETNVIVRDTMQRAAGGASAMPPSPFMGILPPHMWAKAKTFFTHPVNFLGLTPNNPTGCTVRAKADRDLVVYYGAYTARKNGAPVASPYLLVDLAAESGDGYNPNNSPVDIDNLLGTARQPAVWAVPLIVPARQGLTMRITNLSADTLDVRVALMGFEVHRHAA